MKFLLNKIRNILNINLLNSYIEYGDNVHIQWNVELTSPNKHIKIGSNVGINSGTVVISDLEVGDNVLIAPRCGLINRGEHTYDIVGKTIFESPMNRAEKIIIQDDVWIGYGSTILGGLTIGEGAIVAAGSVVIEDVAEYTIVAGNPAKPIKSRFSKEELIRHRELLNQ